MAKKKFVVGALAALFSLALVWRLCFAGEEATVDTAPLAVTAQANLADAQKQVADATVVSPVDGLVANRQVTRGQILTAGNPAMTVEQMDDVYVTCQIEQQYVAYIT